MAFGHAEEGYSDDATVEGLGEAEEAEDWVEVQRVLFAFAGEEAVAAATVHLAHQGPLVDHAVDTPVAFI